MSAPEDASASPLRWRQYAFALALAVGLAAYMSVEIARDAANLERAICAIVFVSAAISSIAGFAFSALASALLLHIVSDTVQAVQIMLVSSIALQAYSSYALRRHIEPRSLAPYLVGGLLALPGGLYLLLHTPVQLYLAGVGGFLVIYGLYALLLQRPTSAASGWCTLPAKAVVGALGGLTGPVVAFPGAFITIWCGLQGWDKQQQRALYQPYILIMQILTLAALQAVGSPRDTPPWLLQYVPPALAGAYIGLRVFRSLTTSQFTRIVNTFLLVSGAALIAKAL